MRRCLELAKRASGNTSPNPLVGAVLVCNDRIIGEGYHEQYGEAHAEVNCLNSVSPENISLINESTLYVSLEPCSHFGKTPPCSDLIIKCGIPRVVIGCRDSFEKVNGSGIEKLRLAGINVIIGILEKECRALNKRFFTFHEKQRPYIILKWAESADGLIAGIGGERTLISNTYSNRLVHKWRAEEAAIFVGTNTVLLDDPALTVRHWAGKNPVRIIIDRELKAPASSAIFDGSVQTIIINSEKDEQTGELIFFRQGEGESFAQVFIRCLNAYQLISVLAEGGARTLQSFIDADLWDEARVISNSDICIGDGVAAPNLHNPIPVNREKLFSDNIAIYKNAGNEFL